MSRKLLPLLLILLGLATVDALVDNDLGSDVSEVHAMGEDGTPAPSSTSW